MQMWYRSRKLLVLKQGNLWYEKKNYHGMIFSDIQHGIRLKFHLLLGNGKVLRFIIRRNNFASILMLKIMMYF